MRMRLGIDEAGRGCVLGPLVFGACLVEEADEPGLRALGVRDSKKLSPARRRALRGELEALSVRWETVHLTPATIDSESLGSLGKQAIIDLAMTFRPDVLVVDAPVPPRGIPAYAAELKERLAALGLTEIEIVAENGADDRHPCCSAASIFAKTDRDASLEELQEEAGSPLGSGYPGDPRTVDFLRTTWARERRWPHFVRTKWETVRRIVAESAQGQLF